MFSSTQHSTERKSETILYSKFCLDCVLTMEISKKLFKTGLKSFDITDVISDVWDSLTEPEKSVFIQVSSRFLMRKY